MGTIKFEAMKVSTILIALLASLCVLKVRTFCLTALGYHTAAKALAVATGPLGTQSPCQYGNGVQLNSNCSYSCSAFLSATWGDCYCKDQSYKPQTGNPLVSTLSTHQIYDLLANPAGFGFQQANCHDWLNTAAQKKKWMCT